jgi:hypothetical protein
MHKPARARSAEARLAARPPNFGDQVIADHVVIRSEDRGSNGERAALIALDRATQWLGAYPVATKSAFDATNALLHFAGVAANVKAFYSDNSPELVAAARAMRWPHTTSTPGRPASNGIAERAVRTVLEAARALLLHAGLPEVWWPFALRYAAFVRTLRMSLTPLRTKNAMVCHFMARCCHLDVWLILNPVMFALR